MTSCKTAKRLLGIIYEENNISIRIVAIYSHKKATVIPAKSFEKQDDDLISCNYFQ